VATHVARPDTPEEAEHGGQATRPPDVGAPSAAGGAAGRAG